MSIFPINLNSPRAPDDTYIRTMFDRMARRYDMFTLLTGFGQAQRWRRIALEPIQRGMRVLDLGCGTGDLALAALHRVGREGEVVGLDFSKAMLAVCTQKYRITPLQDAGALRLVLRKAEELPIDDRRFDAVVSGFVLRNLYAHIDRILTGVRHSLKPRGQIHFLDLTEPVHPVPRALFRGYMLGFAGSYGTALFGKHYPIPYLPDSAGRFFKAHEFTEALRGAGFACISAQSFMLGTVTLYHAVSP